MSLVSFENTELAHQCLYLKFLGPNFTFCTDHIASWYKELFSNTEVSFSEHCR